MSNFNRTTFRLKRSIIGQYYDWTIPANPPGGFYEVYTDYQNGEMFGSTHKRSRDGKYREGGPWLMDKRTYASHGTVSTTYRPGWGLAYVGMYSPHRDDDMSLNIESYLGTPWTNDIDAHWSEVNSYGAQAYAALKPDLPDFSPLVSLFELRDAPRLLQRKVKNLLRKTRKHRRYRLMNKAGRYHLAVQFGWLPLLRDIQDFTKAFSNRKNRFNQLLRDEKKGVRRRRNLQKVGNGSDDMTTTSNVTYSDPWHPYMHPTHVTQCYGGAGAQTRGLKWNQTRVWCAGKSHYWLPPGPRDERWKKRIMRKIMGLYVTPETVYNAMPWTWLVDYFSNLGSFAAAISGGIADRVIFDYAYIMHHKEVGIHHTYEQGVRITKSGTSGRATSVRELVHTRKSRASASPFGFGLNHEDLSPHQLGILGALGLSRL